MEGRSKDGAKRENSKCIKFCEVLVLIVVMLIILGLFSIPTVLFYVLPSSEVDDLSSVNTSSACSQSVNYSGEICRDAFTSLQTCFSGVTSPPPPLNIHSLINQQARERIAVRLVNGLSFLSPSPQCREAILPFLCLSIFTLCDSSNRSHTILREDCLELRDDICAEEWGQAVGFLGAGVLPVCEGLNTEDNSISCPLVASHISNQTTDQQDDPLVCSKGFFLDENVTNICRPICGEFNLFASGVLIMWLAIAMNFVASVIMFILALTIQRDSLLTFPLIFSVYVCVTDFIVTVVLGIGLINWSGLYCGSRDLLVAVQKGMETPFCTFSGQMQIWSLLYTVFVFWAVVFPFSYRQLRVSGRIRYAHIISVILAVVVPLPGALFQLKDGHVISMIPGFACVGRNRVLVNHLPFSIVMAVTSCLLILEFVLKKMKTRSTLLAIGKGELKITLVISYYVLIGVTNMTIAVVLLDTGSIMESIGSFLICESGRNSNCVLEISAREVMPTVCNRCVNRPVASGGGYGQL